MCLGPIFINCCIPLVSREGVALPFLCTLSQFGWLILCCQSAARSCILSLLPNSQLSCKTGCTETFQWFFGLWYLILQPWRRQCAISFPGRDWVPPPAQVRGTYTWAGGLGSDFGIHKSRYCQKDQACPFQQSGVCGLVCCRCWWLILWLAIF